MNKWKKKKLIVDERILEKDWDLQLTVIESDGNAVNTTNTSEKYKTVDELISRIREWLG